MQAKLKEEVPVSVEDRIGECECRGACVESAPATLEGLELMDHETHVDFLREVLTEQVLWVLTEVEDVCSNLALHFGRFESRDPRALQDDLETIVLCRNLQAGIPLRGGLGTETKSAW